MISSIDMLLTKWARWVIRGESRSVGYPSASPMFRDTPSTGVYRSSEPFGIGSSDYQDVTRAVDSLPAVQKACVLHYYQMGGKGAEVAGRLGIQKAVMFKYLHQAHEHIDSFLQSSLDFR